MNSEWWQKGRPHDARGWCSIAVAVLWGGAFLLSCKLHAHRLESTPYGEPSIARAVLGETCLLLSNHFYDAADLYFHKGVAHLKPEAFKESIFQTVATEISPRRHVHLASHEVKEMMPWLCLAIRTNPHRLDTYLVAAFWLATDAQRPDLALDVLQEAELNIPGNHEIQLEKARLLLRSNRIEEARLALDAGLAFWPSGGNPDSSGMKYDRARLLLYRAVLHELEGERKSAAAALRKILVIYPNRKGLNSRIDDLESGAESTTAARERLAHMLHMDAQLRHDATCSHEQHSEHYDDETHRDSHEHESTSH